MIRGYAADAGRLRPVPRPLEDPERVVWFDLVDPDAAEEAAVGRLLGFAVPTREEMEEIEESSRLYRENGAAFMTALLPAGSETSPVIEAGKTCLFPFSPLTASPPLRSRPSRQGRGAT